LKNLLRPYADLAHDPVEALGLSGDEGRELHRRGGDRLGALSAMRRDLAHARSSGREDSTPAGRVPLYPAPQ
jgi:hypothetical protein